MWRAIVVIVWVGCAHTPRRYHDEPSSLLATHGDVLGAQVRKTPVSWKDIVVVTRHRRSVMTMFSGAWFTATSASAPPPAQAMRPATAADPEKLVVEAWLDVELDDIAGVTAAIRERVDADGGRVISENVQGEGKTATSAALELRVPPLATRSLLAWIGESGAVTSRRVLATDVSKSLFEQQLALDNLRLEMTRLQELVKQGAKMSELLEIEKEMTRVRGEIERVEGEQRFLLDRVEFATVTVNLRRDVPDEEAAPHARVHPGAHVAMLSLLDHGTRIGGGATLLVARALTFQIDAFARDGAESRVVIATLGTAMYSGLFGYGRRRYGNPYLGVRAGYGYISGQNATAFAGELGVELVKHAGFVVDVSAAAVALLHDARNDVALHATLGLDVPF